VLSDKAGLSDQLAAARAVDDDVDDDVGGGDDVS
jgi:hypothetical protein